MHNTTTRGSEAAVAASICRNLAHSLAELRRGGRAEARRLQLLLECALGPDTVTNTEAELVLGAGLGLDTPQHRAQPGQAGKGWLIYLL